MGGITVNATDIAIALSLNRSSVVRRSKREKWAYEETTVRGGVQKRFIVSQLPHEIQVGLVRCGKIDDASGLCPEAAMEAAKKLLPLGNALSGESNKNNLPALSGRAGNSRMSCAGLDASILDDDRVARIVLILQEADQVPVGWKKRAWVEAVAEKYNTSYQTIYKWKKKYRQSGLQGLRHTKKGRDPHTAWDKEALDFWIGLVAKQAQRGMSISALYFNVLVVEAHRRGWKIGGKRNAYEKVEQLVSPCLRALQRGGVRALDNNLPPIMRNYADLQPFQLLVGDQHRFDFWVVDDESGELIRPEGYFWQDLRTRIIYGGALGRKYDSQMIGLALRLGIRIWGAFGSVYTDNGKPELSKYLMGVLKDMRRWNMEVFRDEQSIADISWLDEESINPGLITPGGHIKAIVKNAKAKMIEGTFNNLERILRDEMRVPGYVKKLGGDPHENDVDEAEIRKFAMQGKLLTLSEFMLAVLKALDFYNRMKPHRGVRREWAWKPKVRENASTPINCLLSCAQNDGWQPKFMDQGAVDLMFLPQAERKITTGRINFKNMHWECRDIEKPRALTDLNGQRVEIRYDPMSLDSLAVFHNGRFICEAMPVEYSSMINKDLATRKIQEKRRLRKLYIEEYNRLTSSAPDVREFSQVSTLEKAAAVIGRKKRARIAEQEELYRKRTDEELAADVAKLESLEQAQPVVKDLPERPAFFHSELARYSWIVKFEASGGELNESDRAFCEEYESAMSDEDREMWTLKRAYGGQ